MKKSTKVPDVIFEADSVISAASYNGYCVTMYTGPNGVCDTNVFDQKHKEAIANNKIIIQLAIDPVKCCKLVDFLKSDVIFKI